MIQHVAANVSEIDPTNCLSTEGSSRVGFCKW